MDDSPAIVSGEPHAAAKRARQASAAADFYDWNTFRKELLELAQRRLTLAEAGARLYRASTRCPGLLADGDERFPFSSYAGDGGKKRVSPDLLPLPVPSFPQVSPQQLDACFPADAPPTTEGFKLGTKAWLCLLIHGLNQMYTGSARPARGPPTEAQAQAIEHLFADCAELCRDGTSRAPHEWPQAYKLKAESYWGEPVYVATPLTMRQVLPTLPPKGVAASVDVMKILHGQIREQLGDPESLLLPESEWPPHPPRASTQLSDPSEWPLLANELWTRGLCMWLPTDALFSPGGTPLVNGLFGVPKAKPVADHPELPQLRLICNLVPSNSYFRVIRGDIDDLPYTLQWNAITLLEDEFLLISQEDMSSAFYLFRLPTSRARYFAVGKPIRLDQLKGNARLRAESLAAAAGFDCSKLGYLCLITLPMGWASATGVMQAVHRAILTQRPGRRPPLPTAAETRKAGILPHGVDQRFDRG